MNKFSIASIWGMHDHHSGQNLMTSCVLYKNISIKMYKAFIVYVFCRCEFWTLFRGTT